MLPIVSYIIYLYITSKQFMVTLYNKTTAKLIGFQELKTLNSNITIKFILYKCITNYVSLIKKVRNYFDIDPSIVHVVKVYENNKNTIILDNANFKTLTNTLSNSQSDDAMVNAVIMKFELVNGDDDVLCLKHLVSKYKDTNKQYSNTIRNILMFNDVLFNDDSKLNIKLMANKKMVNKNILLSDILDNHINTILYE